MATKMPNQFESTHFMQVDLLKRVTISMMILTLFYHEERRGHTNRILGVDSFYKVTSTIDSREMEQLKKKTPTHRPDKNTYTLASANSYETNNDCYGNDRKTSFHIFLALNCWQR